MSHVFPTPVENGILDVDPVGNKKTSGFKTIGVLTITKSVWGRRFLPTCKYWVE